jgi:hypothetical protein
LASLTLDARHNFTSQVTDSAYALTVKIIQANSESIFQGYENGGGRQRVKVLDAGRSAYGDGRLNDIAEDALDFPDDVALADHR